MATISKIKKITTGKIQYLDAANNIIASQLPKATINPQGDIGLSITDASGIVVVVFAPNITELEIEPNAPVGFSGDAQALWGELVKDFFRG